MIITLTFIVIFLSFLNVITMVTLTGKATAQMQGTTSLCIAHPPEIESIPSQNATSGSVFTYQVNATFYGENSSNSFTDNTSLFNINSSGYISFTPSSSSAGTYTILITALDGSGCTSGEASATMSLIITSSGVTAPVQEGAGGGGGGGGGGTAGYSLKIPCPSGYTLSGSECVKIESPPEIKPAEEVPAEGAEVPQPEQQLPSEEVEAGGGSVVGLAGYSTRTKIFIFAFPLIFLLLLIIFCFMIYLHHREKERDRRERDRKQKISGKYTKNL